MDINSLSKGLRMVHLNTRSLLGGHKFEMVRHQIEGSGVDIFTISESWLTKAVPDRVVECMNYNIVRLDRNWNNAGYVDQVPKRGGGTGVLHQI